MHALLLFSHPPLVTKMIEAIVGAVTVLAVALVGWGTRLESKASVNAQRHDDLLRLIDSKFDVVIERFSTVAEKFEGFDKRLERVERHVLNGKYGEDK